MSETIPNSDTTAVVEVVPRVISITDLGHISLHPPDVGQFHLVNAHPIPELDLECTSNANSDIELTHIPICTGRTPNCQKRFYSITLVICHNYAWHVSNGCHGDWEQHIEALLPNYILTSFRRASSAKIQSWWQSICIVCLAAVHIIVCVTHAGWVTTCMC